MTLIHRFDTSAGARFASWAPGSSHDERAPLWPGSQRARRGKRRRGLSEPCDKCGEAAWQALTFDCLLTGASSHLYPLFIRRLRLMNLPIINPIPHWHHHLAQ
jgi:hypothetical protein